MIVLILLAVLAVTVPAVWIRHAVKRHGLGAVLWRFFSGHSIDGFHRTDATWMHKARKVLHPTGHAVRWHHWPRRTRAAIRTGSTVGAVLLAVAVIAAPRVMAWSAAGLVLAFAVLAVWLAHRKLREFPHPRYLMRPVQLAQHHVLFVRPLHHALAPALGAPPRRLRIAADRSEVVIGLPEGHTASDRERDDITRAVTAKLGIEGPEAEWQLRGRKPQVTFVQSSPPPPNVTFAEILAEVRKAEEHEVVLGKGRHGSLVKISVDNDSPHIGLSMGSGDGKSTVARNLACQLAHHGALLLILDNKLISHMWARGLPNVAYAGTEEEIHNACLWLQAEIRRRNEVALLGADVRGVVHSDVGPRIFVICEELNATQNRLKAFWTSIKGKGDPSRAPSSEALDEAMFIGRQVRVNLLQIGQRLSAKASGSGDARENLGVKVFCDPSEATWKMLVGGDHPRPPAAGHRGRIQVVTRKLVRETQGAFIDPEAARAFALSGTVAIPRFDMPCTGGLTPVSDKEQVGAHGPPGLGNVSDIGPGVPGLPSGAVTLQQAVTAGVHPSRTLAAARKSATRDEGHPRPVGMSGNAHLYSLIELQAYKTAKVRVRTR